LVILTEVKLNSTVVEHSLHHPKVMGLNADAAGKKLNNPQQRGYNIDSRLRRPQFEPCPVAK